MGRTVGSRLQLMQPKSGRSSGYTMSISMIDLGKSFWLLVRNGPHRRRPRWQDERHLVLEFHTPHQGLSQSAVALSVGRRSSRLSSAPSSASSSLEPHATAWSRAPAGGAPIRYQRRRRCQRLLQQGTGHALVDRARARERLHRSTRRRRRRPRFWASARRSTGPYLGNQGTGAHRQPTLLRLLKAAGFELRIHLEPYDDHDDVLAVEREDWSAADRELWEKRNRERIDAGNAVLAARKAG